MDCRDVQNLLGPYSDGELDLVRGLQVEHHLAECTQCAECSRGLKLLHNAIASAALYHPAPSSLREKLRTAFEPARPVPPRPTRERSRWAPLVATAAGILLVVAGVAGGVFLVRGAASGDRLAEQVVASHARSLQVAHLIDVASSDRHTVKPWFQDKLDFSPQVLDLSSHGYVLAGGRMDYLAERPVSALVYHRRKHVINLLTWPGVGGDRPVRPLYRQGYHIRHWERSGMVYWAISDLNGEELDTFVQLLQAVTTATP